MTRLELIYSKQKVLKQLVTDGYTYMRDTYGPN
jgi:hypothetical protein